jgi:hypothetical protein
MPFPGSGGSKRESWAGRRSGLERAAEIRASIRSRNAASGRNAKSARAVDRPSMTDGLDNEGAIVEVQPVDDSIVASPSRAKPGQLAAQQLADPSWVVGQRAVHKLNHGG